MRCVVIETPFAHPKGDKLALKRVLRYLRAALRDCLMRGEAPFASHGLYCQPGVLDDWIVEQRAHGIAAGFAWADRADARVVYTDLGVTKGMQAGIDASMARGQDVEIRQVPGWSDTL